MPFFLLAIGAVFLVLTKDDIGEPLGCDFGKQLEWRWSKEKADLAYCIKKHLPDYDVELGNGKNFYTPITIRSRRDRSIVYFLQKGHQRIVFTRLKDTLFIAEYCPIATGCEVVALDLNTGSKLWSSLLQGIGPTGHSEYLNRVNIETDGKRIVVNGNEAHGRYIEILSPRTGTTLVNKK